MYYESINNDNIPINTNKFCFSFTIKSYDKNIIISGIQTSSCIEKARYEILIECLTTVGNILEDRRLVIYTNDIYLENLVNEWITKWAKNNYNNRPYSDLLEKISNIKKKCNISILSYHQDILHIDTNGCWESNKQYALEECE